MGSVSIDSVFLIAKLSNLNNIELAQTYFDALQANIHEASRAYLFSRNVFIKRQHSKHGR
jgi:hypothetical protein